ncbi:glycosyltransferase family 4 protein [Natronorarus salvus]|uniref:glycosyltransferase family 4 protein n=1 Tax=Natronorarus salvus TaxID=3117733 RepID=UPI002F25FB72
MRILRVAQTIYPDVKGGGAYHAHALSRDQAEMGHDVTVLTIEADRSRPHVERRSGYTVVRYPATLDALGNDISLGLAQHLSAADDFDVVHAHSHLYFSTNLAALARRCGETPLAITNHGLYSQNAPEWVFDRYLRTVGRWTFDQADVVFCYTDVERARLESLGVETEISVVPNGIDTTKFAPEGPTSERIDTDREAILFVGRVVEGKRPRVAIDALSQLNGSERPDLYICGDGPMLKELREYAERRGLADRVVFLGQVAYDEMPALYRSGDLLVLPSRAEGVPRTVLEAMASEIPVVCSSLDQVEGVLGGAGKTAPVDDVDGFTRAIESYVGDPETRANAGLVGRERVKENHEWRETVERTTDELARIADGRGRRPVTAGRYR